jgi:hypothetical protein
LASKVKLVRNLKEEIMYNHGTPVTTTKPATTLTVVENTWTSVEREIDQHVKSIRALINKLRPTEKQKYFNGLLAFIVNEQIEMTSPATPTETDYSKLSKQELTLLDELSVKVQELYSATGDTE